MKFSEGELIFLADDSGKRYWLKVAFGMIKVSDLGAIDGSKFADLEDGGRVRFAGKEFSAFRPGTVDLIESLDRGAQIITPKDSAVIIMNCDVKPGDRVLEIGAGSGGLTTALLAAVGSEGHVHTLEMREDYAQRVGKNLSRTGLGDHWSYQIGDAKSTPVEGTFDAVTMDMPDPWLALDNIVPCLRPGGRIAIYIPNTNQLEASVLGLRDMGFFDVFSLEVMQRRMEVHQGGVRPSFDMLGHTGYMVFGRRR